MFWWNGTQADPLDRLYQPQALEVPATTPRDGPIASINPTRQNADGSTELAALETAPAPTDGGEVQLVAEAKPGVEILAGAGLHGCGSPQQMAQSCLKRY